MKSATLPSYLRYLGTRGFQYCYDLESIEIPAGVAHLGSGCFYECHSLKEVHYYAEDLVEADTSVFSGSPWHIIYHNAKLYLLPSAFPQAEVKDPWKMFTDKIESTGIESITIDVDEHEEVFDLYGIKISNSCSELPGGMYILRKGCKTSKILIK